MAKPRNGGTIVRSKVIAILAMLSVLMAADTALGYYSQSLGRWTSEDPAGYGDGLNLYGYVRSRPLIALDSFGLKLYAIDGTWAAWSDNTNVRKFAELYTGDSGSNRWPIWRYWHGPGFDKSGKKNRWRALWGSESAEIVGGVRSQICDDICDDAQTQVNLVGWSRGATIALAVAEKLVDGCWCCASGPVRKESPLVNWIGLFDAVDMSPYLDPGPVPSIVKRVDHAMKVDVGQSYFPTLKVTAAYPQVTTVYEDYIFGSGDNWYTNHGDIGMGSDALDWMIARAKLAGLQFAR
jgi:hypothetical protein